MTDSVDREVSPRRGRGRPRVIDRERILEAARRLDPETLTMQSLADEVGVPRKTLHYHVRDRVELLRLVAEGNLQAHIATQEPMYTEDWRLAIRGFATSTRDAIIASGRWVDFARFDSSDAFVHLEPAEVALQALEAAGFSEETAARALGFVAEFTLTSARDALARRTRPHHPQRDELDRALTTSRGESYRGLRRLAERDWDEFGSERQFEFDLTVLVYGLERMLAEH